MALRTQTHLFRYLKQNLSRQRCCTYLSAAYRCDELWNKRLENPLIKSISPNDYFYELDRKHKREGKVSAIDVDLFVNSLNHKNGEALLDEVVDIIHRLRRSPETVRTLPSTNHAVLRLLLDTDSTHILLKLLSDPLNYGVFPDHYTTNLLMDYYIKKEDFTAAARISSVKMLQEDFGPKVTQVLTLASCYFYATSDNNQPWEDYTPKVEEPKEEVKIRIRYLRNPYFDDHFDLKEPNHIVGKTLAWVSPLIGGTVGSSCELLGWALYNKWDELEAALSHLSDGKEPVAGSVVSGFFVDILSKINTVKEIMESCEDQDSREKVMSAITRIEGTEGKVAEVDIKDLVDKMIQEEVAAAEATFIKEQEVAYQSWEKLREDEVQFQIEEYKKKQLLAEIAQKKKALEEREEVIYFFDNKERLEMLLPDRKKKFYPKKKSLIFGKKQPRKVDEGYIPPEVIRR
ncbi:small ribosomal subunit protein mS27-like [Penaeus indicus]|uniref:small ribosomal subunit protein mS27-like n=1 Tax=Penaeus indicus TaxID=29960 RepID=UPI00300DAEE1